MNFIIKIQKSNPKKLKKIFFTLATTLSLISCENKTESVANLTSDKDTIGNRREFSIDSTSTDFAAFFKRGAVKVQYTNSGEDWCGGPKTKIYSLYDKRDHNIFTFGIQDLCLVSTKREFDSEGRVSRVYKLINNGDNCFDNADRFYKNDSLLLSTIVPLTVTKLTTIEDSLKKMTTLPLQKKYSVN